MLNSMCCSVTGGYLAPPKMRVLERLACCFGKQETYSCRYLYSTIAGSYLPVGLQSPNLLLIHAGPDFRLPSTYG
ncbi:hypothetical protein KC354_g122 [Hortaea werneckii]|nr:hypothetical protein KC354_g122 [Hortaea werneckii]